MLFAFAAMASAALAHAASAPADELVGQWRTGGHDGLVEIYRCGADICGKIIDSSDLRANPAATDVNNSDARLRSRRLKGLTVLQGFKGGPREWKGGPVYDPVSGDGADRGYLKLTGSDRLEVKGCVLSICETQKWSRVQR